MRPEDAPEEPPFEVIFEDRVETKVATEAQRHGEIPSGNSPLPPQGGQGGEAQTEARFQPIEEPAKKPRRSRWSWTGLALLVLVGGGYAATRLPIWKSPEPTPPAPTARRPAERAVRVEEKHLPKPPPISKLVARESKPKEFVDPVTFVPDQEKKDETPVAPPKVENSPAAGWLEEAKNAEESEPAKAAELYAKVLEAEPKRTDLWRTMGRLWLRAGDRNAASAAFRAHLDRSPEDVGSLNDLAVLEMQVGRKESASELFQRVIQLDSKFASAHLNLGWAYMAMDSKSEALAELKAYAALVPKVDAEVQQAIERLSE